MKKIIIIGCFILFALPATASSHGEAIRSGQVIVCCVNRHEAGLAYAYESLFKTYAIWPKVKAVVKFVINADGSVKDVKILETKGLDTSLRGPVLSATFADKITDAAYTWRFPQVEAGSVTVEIPFLFVPADWEETEITETKKILEGIREHEAERVERDITGVYIFKEFVIECRRERAVPFEVARARPIGDVFARAARDKHLDGEAEKPMRDYLKEVASFLDELGEGPASKLRKKLASRERDMREVEAALADEELYVAVADLGLSKDYNWRIKKANAKKVAKLRGKRERLALEIEKLAKDISTAEETWSRSLAEKRAALITRGEELLSTKAPEDSKLWLVFALAELYVDAGEAAKAAALFQEVIENGEGEIVAEALYGRAQSYVAAGDEENAAQPFLRLTAEYPDSKYEDEAYFRLGEYYASQLEPDKAEEYFLRASRSDAALYRAAWGYYECTDPFGTTYYDRAVPAFKRFLDAAEEESELTEHALKITALSLAEWEPGAPERPAPLDALSRYEDTFGGAEERPYSADVLRALGDAYLYKMDKLPEAAAAYEKLIESFPAYEHLPQVFEALVLCHLLRDDYDGAHDARVRFVNGYGPDSSWCGALDELTRCEAIITWENALYEVAVYYNMLAERKRHLKLDEAPALFESAISHYNEYFDLFPTDEKAYHINFYFAEAYFAVGDYENAAKQYIKTAVHYTDRERYNLDKWDERFTQAESFFKAVLSYGELYEKGDELDGSREIYADKLLNTCEEFLTRYGDSAEPAHVTEVITKIGDVYARKGDGERAREYYLRIIEEYPEPVYTDSSRRWTDEKVDASYIAAIKGIADTYLEEAKLMPAGAEGAEEKYNQYRDWFERAKAEAEKRNVDFEYQMEALE
jgi:TolA-binding protein